MTKKDSKNISFIKNTNIITNPYFSFFENAPIALIIEDFSEVKNYINSILKQHNTNLKSYIKNNPKIISKLISLVTIKDVNAKAVELYNANGKKDLFENIAKVFTDKSGKEFSKLIIDILSGVKETEIESVNKTLDGKEFDVLIKFNLIESSNGNLDNVIVSIENITKKVEARRALLTSENRYKESEIIAKIGSWFYDLKTQEVECTDEVFRIIETTPPSKEKLSIDFFIQFVHPKDKEKVIDYSLKNLFRNSTQDLRYRIITKNGLTKYILEKRSIVFEKNKISRIIGIAQDITTNVISEQKLNTTKNLLSNTISSIKDGFVILNKNSNYIYVNKQAANLLGKSSIDLIGKNIWNEFPEKEGDLFYDEYQRALKTKKPVSFENYFAPWHKWFENRIIPSKNEMLIIFQEITDKKLSENKIKEAYNIINKSPSSAILCKNEFNFPVLFASENSQNLFGYTHDEFLTGKIKVHELVFPEDLPIIRAKIFKKIKQQKAKGFKAKPFRIITNEGIIKWIDVRFDFTKDATNNITHIQAIAEDITEKKRTQDLFYESNQRLKNQFENTPLASILWDVDFKVIKWNNAAERIFEFTAKEAIGKHIRDLIIPKNIHSEIDKIWNELLRQEGGFRNTNKNITKSGKEIICNWYNVTLKDSEGNLTGVASLGNDITETIHSKKLLEKSEKKYRDIFEKSIDAVFIIKDGVFIDCNEATLKIFGHPNKKSLFKLHPSEISPRKQPDGENSFEKAEKLIKIALDK